MKPVLSRRTSVRSAVAACITLSALACAPQPRSQDSASPAAGASSAAATPATPSAAASGDEASGWRSLLDGQDLSQWRAYKKPSAPAAWLAKDGALTKSVCTEDLITREQFGDFELSFDWKLSPGGNAGVFYRGTEEYDHIYWSAPEYQLLDDAKHADGRDRLTAAGAAYALYPSPAGVVKPGGEWNSSRIVVKGAHVEHWLNGTKMVEYELWSPDWKAKVKASKFKDYPDYGLAKRGYIGIQGDHSGDLALRNIRIRSL